MTIKAVRILGHGGTEQTVFERGSMIEIETALEAQEPDTYPFILGVSLYRIDGLLVSNHVAPRVDLNMLRGEVATVRLTLPDVNLGNGRYTFSVAAFRTLDPLGESKLYDLIDRSFEFEIYGNGPFENGVFNHPATWSVATAKESVGA